MNRTRATVDPSISALRVELLGRFMVSRADVNVPETGWRLGKARSLVKLLALAPGCRLHREQVIDLLWPELDFEDGANNLHQVLHVARRTLAPLAPELQPTRIVRLQQHMLALEGPDGVWVDAVAFERLAAEAMAAETTSPGYAAVELYRGDLLPEDLYEDWAAEPREALRRQYLAVLLRLAALHEARHEGNPAIDALRRVVAAEPTHEEAHVGLMRLYALTGRRQQALRQFERLRELLERELAAKPDPITVELNTAIQAGRYPAEVWPAAPPAPAPRTAASAVHPPVEAFTRRSPNFVNREVELRTLHDALGQALSGAGQVVFIAGEPGIGKTRLIEELARHAHTQQVAIRWGRSYHDSGEPAYWPWVQILREHLRTSAPDEITADFGAEAADLARITPELRRWFPELPEPPRLDPEQERFRLFDSVSTVLTRMATRQPLLLVLDDLHWADRSSLLLLEYVAGPLTASRLLVVGAYRHIEVDRRHPLIRTLAELSRQGMTHRIDLHGLDEQAVGSFSALTAGRPAPDGLSSVIYEQTNGNPFFVKEIVQLLLDEERFDQPAEVPTWRIAIPRGIRETMALRRDRLSDNANQVLSIAAVVGRDFGLDVVSAVSARSTIEVLEGLEESLRAGLLTEVAGRPGTFHFVHAIGRRTLYDDLSHARRVTMHHQIGEALEQLHAVDLDIALPELARHFRIAAPLGLQEKAISYLVRAAELAMRQTAYSEAVWCQQQAIGLQEALSGQNSTEICELLIRLSDFLRYSGEPELAMTALQRSAVIAQTHQLPELLARAAIGLSETAYQCGDGRAIHVALLTDAFERLGATHAELRVRLLSRIAQDLVHTIIPVPAAHVQAQVASKQALEIADSINDADLGVVSRLSLQAVLEADATDADRVQNLEDIGRLISNATDRRHQLIFHSYRIGEALKAGDIQSVTAEIDAYERLAVELHQPASLWAASFRRTMLVLLSGDLAEAERLTEATLALGRRSAPTQALEVYLKHLVLIRVEQDRAQEVLALASEIASTYPAFSEPRLLECLALSAMGRTDSPSQMVDTLARSRFAEIPRNLIWPTNAAILAMIVTDVGDQRAAHELYQLLLPFENRVLTGGGHTVALGAASHYLGVLAGITGDVCRAAAHLTQAVDQNLKLGARALAAHSQAELAGMLLQLDTVDAAREAEPLLRQAAETSRHLQLARLERRIVALTSRKA